MADQTYDIVIVGGSLGGVAAAQRSGAMGASVCLIEASGWLGGQFTAQGVSKPDENRYIETVGSTVSYRAFRHAVRLYYRNNYKLSALGASQPTFNPGGPYPGFALDPRIGHTVIAQQLADLPTVHVRLFTRVTAVEVAGDAIVSVTAVDGQGTATRYIATVFLDATDLGEMLALGNVEFRIGAESAADFGEQGAPGEARPDWIQPITVPIALERRPAGENHTIAPPADYGALKAQQHYTIVDGYINSMFAPGRDMWTYRRFISAANFADPTYPYDLSVMNTGSNDYQAATIPTGDAARNAEIVANARRVSVGYLYWLQTECPRDGEPGRFGYPELKPRPDVFGTPDATAAAPYIRESRRIVAQTAIVREDLDAETNPGPRATNYADSCGIGLYGGLDIHGLEGVGMEQQFITIKPFEIPLGALIPIRVTNLLAACKNIGATHLANGAYRLHPVEWNVGEAAGALAAYAVAHGLAPKSVRDDEATLRDFQHALLDAGVPLFWWSDVQYDDPIFSAVHLLGVSGVISGYDDLTFRPDVQLTAGERAAIEAQVGTTLDWPSADLSRGQAALWLVESLGL